MQKMTNEIARKVAEEKARSATLPSGHTSSVADVDAVPSAAMRPPLWRAGSSSSGVAVYSSASYTGVTRGAGVGVGEGPPPA
jgi:hypothetical protein